MRTFYLIIFFCSIVLSGFSQSQNKLWYNKPATTWTEALPLGNGRLGAMVFGGINEELLQLNEATLWSGGPVKSSVNPTAVSYLPKVREALFKGDYAAANELAKHMQGLYSESFMPLGDLVIKQKYAGNQPVKYYRELNIQDAVSTVKFSFEGVEYKREVFASAPDQVIVMRLSSSKPKQLNVSIGVKSILHFKNEILNNNQLSLRGKAPSHVDPNYLNSANPVPNCNTFSGSVNNASEGFTTLSLVI